MKIKIGPFLKEHQTPRKDLNAMYYSVDDQLMIGRITGEAENEFHQKILNIQLKIGGVIMNSLVRKTRVSQFIDFNGMFRNESSAVA